MTFLAPIAAITAGLIGIPVLIALYLLKLRRRPVRVGSTMLWEQAVRDVQVNVPFRWLRPSWLLVLHLLILALFVLSLGRPVIEGPVAAGARVFLVIDRSASMNVRDMPGGASRLEAALERAGVLADELTQSAQPEIVVVQSAIDAQLAGRPARTASEVRRQLATISPTDQPGTLTPALDLVRALLPAPTEEDDTPDPALVVLLTDGGSLDRAALTLSNAVVRFERLAGSEPSGNVGIVAAAGARDREDPVLVRVFVSLINTSAQRQTVPVAIRVNGSVADRTAIQLPGHAPDSGLSLPEEIGRTLSVRVPEAALVEVEIDREDQLSADNRVAMALPAPRRPSILMVAPGVEGDPRPDPFIADDVLGAIPTRQFRVVSGPTYERLAASAGAFDLIVFDRVAPLNPPARPSVFFGVAPPGVRARPGAAEPTGVTRWARSHPAMTDVTLDALTIGRRMVFDEALPETSTYDDVTPLVWTPEGPVIVELTRGSARSIAVGFAATQSNWPVQVSFPIFVAATVDHLVPSAGAAQARSGTTGTPARFAADPGDRDVVLTGPRDLRGTALAPGGLADLGIPERAGVYQSPTTPGPDGAFPVNLLSSAESALLRPEEVTVGGALQTTQSGERAGRIELWPWCVGAAFVLLLIDWGLYAILMRV